jgi:hypothetical protein
MSFLQSFQLQFLFRCPSFKNNINKEKQMHDLAYKKQVPRIYWGYCEEDFIMTREAKKEFMNLSLFLQKLLKLSRAEKHTIIKN